MIGGYAVWSLLGALAAGSLGAVLRWASVSWLHGVLSRRTADTDPFPLGVLMANLIASFMAGMALPLASVVGAQWRLVIVAGLCGGLSTLSTLAVDTVSMWQRRHRAAAIANLSATLVLGVFAAALGAHVLGSRIAAAWGG